MAVAYSQSRIVRGILRTGNQAQLRADLDAVLTSAGWTVKSAVTDGFLYTITSPDGFVCKVLAQDDGSFAWPAGQIDGGTGDSVVVQFMSFDEAAKGFPHQLRVRPFLYDFQTPTYQVVAGVCQLFISSPGNPGTRSSQLAGGIPARPANTGPCVSGVGPAAITDLWWSSGGWPNGDIIIDFRNGPNCNGGSSYCQSGAVSVFSGSGPDPFDGRLCLLPLTPTNTYRIYHDQHPVVTYDTLTPLNIDALLGWQWKIRGQLWDAFVQTTAVGVLDDLASFEDLDAAGNVLTLQAIAWHVSYYSTLQLIFGDPLGGAGGGTGNIAF